MFEFAFFSIPPQTSTMHFQEIIMNIGLPSPLAGGPLARPFVSRAPDCPPRGWRPGSEGSPRGGGPRGRDFEAG